MALYSSCSLSRLYSTFSWRSTSLRYSRMIFFSLMFPLVTQSSQPSFFLEPHDFDHPYGIELHSSLIFSSAFISHGSANLIAACSSASSPVSLPAAHPSLNFLAVDTKALRSIVDGAKHVLIRPHISSSFHPAIVRIRRADMAALCYYFQTASSVIGSTSARLLTLWKRCA